VVGDLRRRSHREEESGTATQRGESHPERRASDANGRTPIGFGIDGSQAANEKINETTVGITQTLFRDAKIGGMQLMLQFSNVRRTPFMVPAGTPSDAKMNMVYVNVRYILP
jgi:hypothetical protein